MTGPVNILKAPMDLLGRKALILLREAYGKPDREYQNRFLSLGLGRTQKQCTAVLSEADRGLGVEEIAERYLKPMTANLAASLPRDVAFVPLKIPSGHQACRHLFGDVSARLITGWQLVPIFDDDGEIVGYDPDVPVLRIDVLVTTEVMA